jgi:hypothetical protein
MLKINYLEALETAKTYAPTQYINVTEKSK